MKMTGGRAIVEAARANGMRTIFGLPGAQIYALFDGLHATGTDLIVPRHEQAAAYMAMGYAKSTGRTGAFTRRSGPRSAEHGGGAVHGDGQLRAGGVPHGPSAVAIPRQGPRSPARARGPGRHSAHADQGRRPHRRPGGHVARSSRARSAPRAAAGPGPVSVEMCWDTMAAEADVDIGPGDTARDEPEPDLDAIARGGASCSPPRSGR